MIRRRNKKSNDTQSRNRQVFLEGLEERTLLATVVTDKLDYAPAETALITATDYQVGETIKFQVLHIDGTPNTGNGHEPWFVEDGSGADLDGVRDGNIETAWFVDPDDSAGATFELSAQGASSGRWAVHTFTDSPPPGEVKVIKDAIHNSTTDFAFTSAQLGNFSLDDDAGVTDGNNTLANSRTFTNLAPGTYVITESALAGWNLSNLVIDDPDNGSSVNLAARTATLDVDAGECVTVTFTNCKLGEIKVIKDAIHNSPTDFAFTSARLGNFSLDDDAGVTGGDNTLASSTTFDNLFPGTYVITESELSGWNLANLVINDPDNGSSVNLATRTATIDLDVGECITVTFTNKKLGEIKVIKDAIHNSPTDFAFTSARLGNFSLDDDAGVTGGDNTLANSTTFDNLSPGTYVITESALAGWDLTNLVIEDPDNGSSVNLATRTATIDLDVGECITVTFTNKKRGEIKVIKDAIPNDLADFAFTSARLGNFSLDDDAGVAGGNNTLANSTTFDNLSPGTYVITESALSGWNLANLVIDDPDNGSSVNLATRTATIDVDAGECITVTFTNKKRGRIVVIKDAIPNDAADFAFTSARLGNFSLDDDFGAPGGNNTLFRSTSFNNLAPGTYVVSESELAGWDLTKLVINDPDNGSSVNLVTRTATIDLDPGELVTVTFTNKKLGGITVVKNAIPNDLADFAFTSARLGNFSLDDDAGVAGGNNTLLNSTTFNNLTPGTYVIRESALAGWNLSDIVINDPDNGSSVNLVTRTATIDLDAGESITVTFTNGKLGRITVVKDAIPNDAADFDFNSARLGNFSLDDDFGAPGGNNTLLRSTSFNNLTPGTYVVSEAALAGWDLTKLVINDPDNGSSVNLVTRTATIDVDAGEFITVTFTNRKAGGITVVKDTVDNALANFDFISAQLGDFTLDDDAGVPGGNDTLPNSLTFSNLVPGTYVIREALTVGWILRDLVIDDPDNGSSINLTTRTATIDVDPGEAITVTFVNVRRPVARLQSAKTAIPRGPTDFDFSSPRLGGFRLRDDGGGLLDFRDFLDLEPGTYQISEDLLEGWDLTNIVINDPDNGSSINFATRTAILDLDPDEFVSVRFTNTMRGVIRVVKDAIPNDLADFAFTSAQLGNFSLDDDFGVPGADNTLLRSTNFRNLVPGTYVITESELAGWDLTSLVIDDPDNGSSINLATGTATIDVDPGELVTVTFTNSRQPDNVVVITPAKSNASLPYVHVVNSQTGEVIARFLAYEAAYRGGVRVATGDLTGDGIAEIVTAPGRGHTPLVRVWDQAGNLLREFMAFSTSFVGGVDISVGDVDGDGFNDIATAMSYDGNEVSVFTNTLAAPNPSPSFALLGPTSQHFYPFGPNFKGGVTIKLADMGTPITVNNVPQLSAALDGKAELIIGSGTGIAPAVKVFSYFGAATLPSLVRTINPFTPTFRGGMSLDVANINDDPGQNIPDIIVGAGNGGGSQVQILNGLTGAIIGGFTAFTSADTSSYNAPIDVAARDESGDGIADVIFVVQGSDGTASVMRKFAAQTGALISSLPESAFDSVFQGTPINDFAGAFYVATLDGVSQPAAQAAPANLSTDTRIVPSSPSDSDGLSLDGSLLVGNQLTPYIDSGAVKRRASQVQVHNSATRTIVSSFQAFRTGELHYNAKVEVKARDTDGDGIFDALLVAHGKSREVRRLDPLASRLVDEFFARYPGA